MSTMLDTASPPKRRSRSPRLIFPLDMSSIKSRQSLGFQATALLCSYTLYGYLQEKIMTTSYGGTKFRASVLLVAFNRLAGIMVAIYMQRYHFQNSLQPRHSIYAYSAVSLSNFLSTLCQYEALKYVNFTTQTLGKCSKMVPVLLIGSVIYGKKYKLENYLAVGLVTLGTTLYMITTQIASGEEKLSTLKGLMLLVGYLFFDGLASTTEEKMFKRNKDKELSGRAKSEMVYDQMLWINVCSLAVSGLVIGFDKKHSMSNFLQLATSPSGPRLLFDILLLSLSASVGLIFLLTIIATFGALTSSTLMTSRQFFSIVLNGAAFGNGRNVGTLGWIGIGYVASGVSMEVKNKRRKSADEGSLSPTKKVKKGNSDVVFRHFMLPIIGGLIARLAYGSMSLISAPFVTSSSALLFPVADMFEYRGDWYSRSDIEHMRESVTCPPPPERSFYPNTIAKTALASYPRSGNTFTRELVEHSTGWYTTDVRCNTSWNHNYFVPACKQKNNFLVKTHEPENRFYGDPDSTWAAKVDQFDQVVQLVRNPLDAIWSFWHLTRNETDHAQRVPGIDKLGIHQLSEVDYMAHSWMQHTNTWLNLDKPREVIRYEDLRGTDQIQHLARVLKMILPKDELPSMERLICADDDRHIAYKSRKAKAFYSWDHYTEEVRGHVLSVVKKNWCILGFEDLIREHRGHSAIDCN